MDYSSIILTVSLSTLCVAIITNYTLRVQRINKFEEDFFKIYKGNGVVLEILIPAGINNLRNEKEIRMGLEKINNRIKSNRMNVWKSEFEKVGYKRFFQFASEHGIQLNGRSVFEVITKIKTENFKKEDSGI